MSPLNITQPLDSIRYMVYNGYYKVMSNIPKMGHLTTPVITLININIPMIGFPGAPVGQASPVGTWSRRWKPCVSLTATTRSASPGFNSFYWSDFFMSCLFTLKYIHIIYVYMYIYVYIYICIILDTWVVSQDSSNLKKRDSYPMGLWRNLYSNWGYSN